MTGKYLDRGYIKLRAIGHPSVAHMEPKHQWVCEHRLVMEAKLKRYLRPDELVWHKNGDRTDNRIENLVLTNKAGLNKLEKRVTKYIERGGDPNVFKNRS